MSRTIVDIRTASGKNPLTTGYYIVTVVHVVEYVKSLLHAAT
jgi:hypothetical protein